MTIIPQFTVKQLLEAGVHFGHKTMRRNPKMTQYVHSKRNGLSIIDLNKSARMLHQALIATYDVAKNNGKILFVATKKQAADIVADAAQKSGQYYVNHRWLGGMLTNLKTVSGSIDTLKKTEEKLQDPESDLNKKEKLVLDRKRLKLEKTLGGIKSMGGYPDLIIVIDVNKEDIAIKEAQKLNIPVLAIVDTNCSPEGVKYVVPGNDDSTKAIKLYCKLLSDTILSGIKENMAASGVDLSKVSPKLSIDSKKKEESTAPAKKESAKEGGKPKASKKKIVVKAKGEEKAEESPNKKVVAKKDTSTEIKADAADAKAEKAEEKSE